MGLQKTFNIKALGAFDPSSGGSGGKIDENRIIIKDSIIPEATEEQLGKIYCYSGETNATYIHGYIYECKGAEEAQSITTDFNPGKMAFDYEAATHPYKTFTSDADAMSDFITSVLKIDNPYDIVGGSLVVDENTIVDPNQHLEMWFVNCTNKNGQEVLANYKINASDLEAYGFQFTNPAADYHANEPIAYTLNWVTTIGDIHWERINVQPSSAEEVALLSITTAPSGTFVIGSKYYNSTEKKIYTATVANSWTNAAVEDPSFNAIYLYSDQAYVWDGNSLELFELEEYQRKLVSGVNIKSINGNSVLGSGNLAIRTYQAFNSGWPTNTTFAAFLSAVNSDTAATAGMAYLGELSCSGLPMQGNVEATVEIQNGPNGNKTIYVVITSGTNAPYRWEYTYWNNGNNVSGWISFQPELPSQTGHSGEFLTTDGSTLSWAPSSASPSSATWYTNNTGTTITILDTTNYNFVEIYKNGLLLEYGQDYTISGTTLTLASALVNDDKIAVKINDLSSIQLDGIEALLHNINSGDNE